MVYTGARHTIWVGDCLDVLPTLPPKVGLIVTSPPYFARQKYGDDARNFENAPTWQEYLDRMARALQLMHDVLLPGGRACIIIDDKYTSVKTHDENFNYGTHAHLIVKAQEIGFLYKGLIIWKKMRQSHASGGARKMLGTFPYPPSIPITTMFEFILVFKKRGTRRAPSDIKQQSKISESDFLTLSTGVWEIQGERAPYGSCPAPFPLEIPRRLIRLFSFVDDIVLDPFAGSGTTLLAAVMEKRIGWGIEINPIFAKEAHERVSTYLFAE